MYSCLALFFYWWLVTDLFLFVFVGWLASWTEDEDFEKKEEIKIFVMVKS